MSFRTIRSRLRLAVPRVLAACVAGLVLLGEIPHRCCLFGEVASCLSDAKPEAAACCCAAEGPTGTIIESRDRDECRCEVGAPAIPVAAPRIESPTVAAAELAPLAVPPTYEAANAVVEARARAGPLAGVSPPLWILNATLRI